MVNQFISVGTINDIQHLREAAIANIDEEERKRIFLLCQAIANSQLETEGDERESLDDVLTLTITSGGDTDELPDFRHNITVLELAVLLKQAFSFLETPAGEKFLYKRDTLRWEAERQRTEVKKLDTEADLSAYSIEDWESVVDYQSID